MSLPEGTVQLAHQVAGHRYVAKSNKLGLLKHLDGCILKPVFEDKRGEREMKFYSKLACDTESNKDEAALKEFLPKFFGVHNASFSNRGVVGGMPPDLALHCRRREVKGGILRRGEVSFMRLEDMTDHFQKPCILDIKIGPQTYDMYATPEKILKEQQKYPPVKEIGFRILGWRVYDHETNAFSVLRQDYFKTLLNKVAVIEALGTFFSHSTCKQKILNILLDKLKSLNEWMNRQRSFVFYSSSLLIVYEGASPSDRNDIQCDKLELKMIDFAHVFPSSELDSNYVFGLERFINCIKVLLNRA